MLIISLFSLEDLLTSLDEIFTLGPCISSSYSHFWSTFISTVFGTSCFCIWLAVKITMNYIFMIVYIYPFLHACVTKCQVPWCIAWLILMSSTSHIHIGHDNKNKQVKYHWIIPNISTKHILCVKAICRKLLFRAWGPHPVNFCGPKTIWKYLHRNTLQIHQFCGVRLTYRSKFMKAPFLVARASSLEC